MKTSIKPFICGGYTQGDWDALNGAYINDSLRSYAADYINDPLQAEAMFMEATKPIWA